MGRVELHNFFFPGGFAGLPDFSCDNQFNFLFFLYFLDYRIQYNESEEISFFTTNNSPPSSPRPCPISPCHSDSSLLSMEDDIVDFNAFINKDKKPFSPARKRLNMDALVNLNQSPSSSSSAKSERHHLQSINDNSLPFGLRATSKRSLCNENSQSPHNKRCRSENQSPSIFTLSNQQPQQPVIRKTVSIMSVLTSSSEMLRKNRL